MRARAVQNAGSLTPFGSSQTIRQAGTDVPVVGATAVAVLRPPCAVVARETDVGVSSVSGAASAVRPPARRGSRTQLIAATLKASVKARAFALGIGCSPALGAPAPLTQSGVPFSVPARQTPRSSRLRYAKRAPPLTVKRPKQTRQPCSAVAPQPCQTTRLRPHSARYTAPHPFAKSPTDEQKTPKHKGYRVKRRTRHSVYVFVVLFASAVAVSFVI